MFTVLVFNDGRNDYLEQTLSTFVDQVIFPERPHTILIDDMPAGRDDAYLYRLVERFAIDSLILNDVNLGLFGAVMKAWSSLPDGTDYIFHLQNDFVFPTRIEVAQLQAVLREPSICNITLLRQPWYEDEREAGSVFDVRPERFHETTVREIPVCLHRDYFGLNPGLYRREFARVIVDPRLSAGDAIPWLEGLLRDALLAEDSRRQFAILGRRGDPPRVLHIGHRRVGISLDHRSPVRDPSAVDSLSQRLRVLSTERRVLATRVACLGRAEGADANPSPAGISENESIAIDLEEQIALAERHRSELKATLDQMQRDRTSAASGAGRGGRTPRRRERNARILMYHRVNSLTPDPAGLCTDPATFRIDMEEVARRCEPLPLADLVACVADDRAPRNAVAITIDDGYVDAFTASDILRNLNLPVTLFATSQAGGETFHDTLARIFIGPHSLPHAFDFSIADLRFSLPETSDRMVAFRAANDFGFPLSSDLRRQLLDALRRWSGIAAEPRDSHRLMTPAEVREFASRSRHVIGAHTENHLVLPSQPSATKRHEILENRLYLQAVTGREVLSLAYPYGIWDDEAVEICRDLGFVVAVTVSGTSVLPWDDPLLAPRIEVKGRSVAELIGAT